MVKLTPGLILGGIATTAAVGLVGYAAWFDYERRNNPEFRRKLLKEQRKEAKASINAAKQAQAGQSDALRSAVRQMKNERPPASVEEREAYFLEQVAIGEALAAKGPQFYVPAAISFFKGLQVYPQPQELLMIYQRTQPAEVVALLMEALRLSITDAEGDNGDDEEDDARQSQQQRLRARQARAQEQPVLEEIDTDSNNGEDSAANSSSKAAQKDREASNSGSGAGSAAGSQNGDGQEKSGASTSSSSPGASARSYVNVEYPQSAEKIY